MLPDDLPYVTGSIGLLGTKPSYEMMEDCDTLLMVGSSFPYSEFLPEPGQARARADRPRRRAARHALPDGGQPRRRRARDAAGAAPAARRARRTAPGASRSRTTSPLVADPRGARSRRTANPLNPQLVFHELRPRLPDNAILTADSGSSTNWFARHLRLRRGMRRRFAGTLATMGPALPYALAAKFAYPDRPVIAAHRRRRDADDRPQRADRPSPSTAAAGPTRGSSCSCCNNRDLNQVTWEQRVMSGDPKLEAIQTLPDFPYARYAELLGFNGLARRSPRAGGRRVGPGAGAEPAGACWRPSPIRRCRRCRRTSVRAGQDLASALAQGDPPPGRSSGSHKGQTAGVRQPLNRALKKELHVDR